MESASENVPAYLISRAILNGQLQANASFKQIKLITETKCLRFWGVGSSQNLGMLAFWGEGSTQNLRMLAFYLGGGVIRITHKPLVQGVVLVQRVQVLAAFTRA